MSCYNNGPVQWEGGLGLHQVKNYPRKMGPMGRLQASYSCSYNLDCDVAVPGWSDSASVSQPNAFLHPVQQGRKPKACRAQGEWISLKDRKRGFTSIRCRRFDPIRLGDEPSATQRGPALKLVGGDRGLEVRGWWQGPPSSLLQLFLTSSFVRLRSRTLCGREKR